MAELEPPDGDGIAVPEGLAWRGAAELLREMRTKQDGVDAVWPAEDEGREAFAMAVGEAVRRKGHCVVRVSDPDEMKRGVLKTNSVRDYTVPRPEFQKAYLGRDAQSKSSWLDRVSGDPSEDPVAWYLGRAADLCGMLDPIMPDFCGFKPWGLHAGSLLRAPLMNPMEVLGEEALTPEDIADGAVEQHLDFIQRRRLALLYPIDSHGSTVRLFPREDLALAAETLSLQPDELLIFRHDVISFSYQPSSSSDLMLQTWILDQPQQLKLESLEGGQGALEALIGGAPIPRHKDVHVMCGHCRFNGSAYHLDRAWLTWGIAGDGFIEIPMSRWDVNVYYSEETGFPGKASTKHAAFLDFGELTAFDNKFFGFTDREAECIVPGQRCILEISAEMLKMGLDLDMKDVKGRPIAVCLADIGSDWSFFQNKETHEKEWLKVGAVGNSNLSCMRMGWCFGMTGPVMQVDTACSSALVAANCLHQLVRQEKKGINEALMNGHLNFFSPFPFVGLSAAGMLGKLGRSATFDQGANGYNRGEGIGGLILKRSDSVKDTFNRVACFMTSFTNQDGRSASLTAPNGPSQQACMRNSMRECNLQPDDIAITENHGTGTALGDPIEVGSCRAVFGRRKGPPIGVTSGKTHMGHLESCAGSVGLLKIIVSLNHMGNCPNNHLRFINAHIEIEGFPVLFPVEMYDMGVKEGIAGLNSFGFGGTNARGELWGRCTVGPRKAKHWSEDVNKLDMVTVTCPRCMGQMRWLDCVAVPSNPDGGKPLGTAIREELASYDYCSNCYSGAYDFIHGDIAIRDAPDPGRRVFLTGTWSSWSTFEEMHVGDGTTYMGQVVLGETLRERFRIVVDQDSKMLTIYPTISRAGQKISVVGPDGKNKGEDWLIDGRNDGVPPGTAYRVTFDWSSIMKSIRWEPLKEKVPPAVTAYEHTYWICGSLTSWRPQSMKSREEHPGVWEFSCQIPNKKGGGSFTILRDNDATQTIYPLETTTSDTSVPVMGPGDGTPMVQSFQHWQLDGALGTPTHVRLQVVDGEISVAASVGADALEAVWRSPSDKQDRYFFTGNLNGWGFTEMGQDPEAPDQYRLRFPIDQRCVAQFQIVVNRNWETRIFPPHSNAPPGQSIVLGPSPHGNGLNWTVPGLPGQVMELVLDLAAEDRMGMVLCEPCTTAVEDA